MDFNKIKNLNKLKEEFNLFDYYIAKLNVLSNENSVLKLSESQKEELIKDIKIENIFNIEKNTITFFALKIKLNQKTLMIENIFDNEICYLDIHDNLSIKLENNAIEINTGDFKRKLYNIKTSQNNITVNGDNKETIESGVKFQLIPIEKYLYDILYRLLKEIFIYFKFKENYYIG